MFFVCFLRMRRVGQAARGGDGDGDGGDLL